MSGHNKGPGCAARSNFPDIAVVLLPWYPICGTYSEARWLYRSPARPIVPPGVCSALTLYYNMCSGCDFVSKLLLSALLPFFGSKACSMADRLDRSPVRVLLVCVLLLSGRWHFLPHKL